MNINLTSAAAIPGPVCFLHHRRIVLRLRPQSGRDRYTQLHEGESLDGVHANGHLSGDASIEDVHRHLLIPSGGDTIAESRHHCSRHPERAFLPGGNDWIVVELFTGRILLGSDDSKWRYSGLGIPRHNCSLRHRYRRRLLVRGVSVVHTSQGTEYVTKKAHPIRYDLMCTQG